LKRNRIKIRTDNIPTSLLSPQQQAINQNTFPQYFGPDRHFNESEVIEMNQTSIPRRLNIHKSHSLPRNPSSQRLQSIFVIGGGGTSDAGSSNP
jgi:hypothetical protein